MLTAMSGVKTTKQTFMCLTCGHTATFTIPSLRYHPEIDTDVKCLASDCYYPMMPIIFDKEGKWNVGREEDI